MLEPDGGGSVCYPALPAWDRLTEIFRHAQAADGANSFVGRRLPELFREAGRVYVGVEVKADIYPAGHSRRTLRADLVRSMRPKILAAAIASEDELDEVDRAVREHLSDPATPMLPHLLMPVASGPDQPVWCLRAALVEVGSWLAGVGPALEVAGNLRCFAAVFHAAPPAAAVLALVDEQEPARVTGLNVVGRTVG